MSGISLLRRAAAGLIASGAVSHIVVTAPAEEVDRFRAELEGLPDGSAQDEAGRWDGIEVVAGSPRSRQASVALGLTAALAAVPQADVVVVHDAARALTPPEVTQRVIAAVRAGHEAVVPALPVTDTVKEVETASGRSRPRRASPLPYSLPPIVQGRSGLETRRSPPPTTPASLRPVAAASSSLPVTSAP